MKSRTLMHQEVGTVQPDGNTSASMVSRYTRHQFLRDTQTMMEFYVDKNPNMGVLLAGEPAYLLRRAIISLSKEPHLVMQSEVESVRWVLSSGQ